MRPLSTTVPLSQEELLPDEIDPFAIGLEEVQICAEIRTGWTRRLGLVRKLRGAALGRGAKAC